MASKTTKKSSASDTEEAKETKKRSSRSIQAEAPEGEDKPARTKKKAVEPVEKQVRRPRSPVRKLGGADHGAEAAAAESREHKHRAAPGAEAREKSAAAREYKPEGKYKVGDVIFHPFWREEGRVIEVGKTPGNIDKIVVEFDRLGTKRLVQNYSATRS